VFPQFFKDWLDGLDVVEVALSAVMLLEVPVDVVLVTKKIDLS
jgi:hypothetical protein